MTQYIVDPETSRNTCVIDRCGNRTVYAYDEAGRTTKVTSQDVNGEDIAHVSYAYDAFNNLTEITRGDGMKYALTYNSFHNLQSIGVDGTGADLVTYTYKNGNGRLKEVTYANGHTMKATYNSFGQLSVEKWQNASNTLVAHYKYVYDGQGNIVRSIDMTAQKEYTYIYDEGKITSASAYGVTINGQEIITGKKLLNTIRYSYDKDGNLTRKQFAVYDDNRNVSSEQTYQYTYPEEGEPIVTMTIGGITYTSQSKNDHFGRKEFDELQVAGGFVSRQFSYVAGKATDTHIEKGKLKSTPTTSLVSQIVLSNGRTLSYKYDPEERITEVKDTVIVDDVPVVSTTKYTYDELGQLKSETVDGTPVNTMTYDSYGNIKTKNGVEYVYDDVWRDKLIKVGDDITYDAQGNPLSYRGHTLTWEKGRQLKSLDGITYTYNANGIRTSKTVNGVKHEYLLDGTKILRETWSGNTLVPLYDNEDSVCGIVYNGTPYYFLKNQQGDIIGIVDKDAEVVAKYSYDAWGVCTVTQDSVGIATINPFRYRGYYYDEETGLYYLQSRYYDPETGRFINADDAAFVTIADTVLVYNLFTYCYNGAVSLVDPDGYKAKDLQTHLNLKNGKSGKLKIQIKKNKITIFANFMLFGDLAQKRIERRPYMFWFANGIRKFWQGSFSVFGYRVSLTTNVSVKYDSASFFHIAPSGYIPVITKNEAGTSHVAFSILGWGKDRPGTVYLFRGDNRMSVRHRYSRDQFERVCAHEFGHIMGMLDLYTKSEKLKSKYSPKGNYSMMCNQWIAKSINNYDLEKILTAFQKNRTQDWR